MKDKVRIGIIGTGFARRVQIPAFLKCADTAIVSVASGRLENAEGTAREFNIEHFTDDWQATVEREDIDLICITTPPNQHFEQTLFAIERGKHVLCEKPMSMNAGEAQTMTEKGREKGVLALIDHELRFQNGRQKAYSMLRDGAIGKVRHAKYNFRNASRGDATLSWTWWSDKSAGGGSLGAIGSHVIDSFLWFLGADVERVFCQLQTHIKQRKDAKTGEQREVTSDDEANLTLRFAESDLTQDATGLVSISMTEYPKYVNCLEFFGTAGAIRIDYLGEIFLAKAGETDWRKIETEIGKPPSEIFDSGFPSGFMSFAPKVVEAILNEKTEIEHAATFEDGLRVQKILDAAHESNESGCLVKIK
ncbi:MAG: Gfo/Idh/MocA family oxidoreductase [Acidobacteriota bacterium]|nr:Gfo/Idh/MocA family oxidoreductase [Acidobacteriota bacterium]